MRLALELPTPEDHAVPGPVFRYLLTNALYAYLKENPEMRQGEAVMNLLREPGGRLPTTAEVLQLEDSEIHERINATLKWTKHRKDSP